MFAEDWSSKLDQFKKYTHELDVSRKENLYELIPEFKEI